MIEKGDRKQILLRLSAGLYQNIAAWAEDDFRSVNGQIEFLLSECVRRRGKKLIEPPDEGQQLEGS